MAVNRIAILKARAAAKKNPLSRAVRAPSKRVEVNPCPNGTCEHPDGAHVRVRDESSQPVAESIRCARCHCREIRWPNEETT